MSQEQAQAIVAAVEKYRPRQFQPLYVTITTNGFAAVAYKSVCVPSTVQGWFRKFGAASNHTGNRFINNQYVDVLWFDLKEIS